MIISFREGLSGSWLAELLTLGTKTPAVYFRQDQNGANVPADVFHYDGTTREQNLNAVKRYNNQKIITCHCTDYALLRTLWPNKTIVRITPRTKVFQCIAASFYKLGNPQTATVDTALEYIKDYYHIHKNLDPLPNIGNSAVIDFGSLTDLDQLTDLARTLFGVVLEENHQTFFEKYWQLQKHVVDENKVYPGITKDSLLKLFSQDATVFNLACFIFVYEKANGLTESSRAWAIDEVPGSFERLAEFMTYRD